MFMSIQSKPMGYWMQKERCIEAARKCKTRNEFQKKYRTAYKNCLRFGWSDEAYHHMISYQKPRGYWQDKVHCREAASQCKTRKEFRKKFKAAYDSCRAHGWYEEICSDLEVLRDIYKWSSVEAIHEEAKKYKSRTEFAKKNGAAFSAAHRLGVIEFVCSHMEKMNDYCSRGIYAFEFPDNHVYVGLTYNFVIRKCSHLCCDNSQVYRHIQETNLQPVFKILHNYTDMYVAAKLEGKYLDKYIKNGWVALNIQIPGNLGGSRQYYTRKRILELAQTCETLSEFRIKYEQAYNAARKHRWLKEIKEILPSSVNQFGSFQNTYNDVLAYARTCKSYREFSLGRPSAVKFARRKGFIDEITAFLPPKVTSKPTTNKYLYEDVIELARLCRSLIHFRKEYSSAYGAALKNGWIDDVQKILPRQVHKKYTKKEVLSTAKSCRSYWEFHQGYSSIYNVALNNGWLDEIREIFGVKAPTPEYQLDNILEVARNCESYREFQNHHSIYQAARKKGWLKEVYKILPRQMHENFTKEEVISIAKGCSNYIEFLKTHVSAYTAARKNNWLKDVQNILPPSINKPYTKRQVIDIARRCQTYTEFTHLYRYAYKAACNKGWIDDVKKFLAPSNRPPYTKDEIFSIANGCKSYKEFQTQYASAYVAAGHNGWLDELRSVFPNVKRKPFMREEILEIVSSCGSYAEFYKKHRNAYKAAGKMSILDELKKMF